MEEICTKLTVKALDPPPLPPPPTTFPYQDIAIKGVIRNLANI